MKLEELNNAELEKVKILDAVRYLDQINEPCDLRNAEQQRKKTEAQRKFYERLLNIWGKKPVDQRMRYEGDRHLKQKNYLSAIRYFEIGPFTIGRLCGAVDLFCTETIEAGIASGSFAEASIPEVYRKLDQQLKEHYGCPSAAAMVELVKMTTKWSFLRVNPPKPEDLGSDKRSRF